MRLRRPGSWIRRREARRPEAPRHTPSMPSRGPAVTRTRVPAGRAGEEVVISAATEWRSFQTFMKSSIWRSGTVR